MNFSELAGEINRKTLDTFERFVIDRENGVITEAEYHAGLDALWGATAGIVDEEIASYIGAALQATRRGIVDRHLLIKPDGGLIQVVHHRTKNLLEIKSRLTYLDGWQEKRQLDFSNEPNPGRATLDKVKLVLGGLLKNRNILVS